MRKGEEGEGAQAEMAHVKTHVAKAKGSDGVARKATQHTSEKRGPARKKLPSPLEKKPRSPAANQPYRGPTRPR